MFDQLMGNQAAPSCPSSPSRFGDERVFTSVISPNAATRARVTRILAEAFAAEVRVHASARLEADAAGWADHCGILIWDTAAGHWPPSGWTSQLDTRWVVVILSNDPQYAQVAFDLGVTDCVNPEAAPERLRLACSRALSVQEARESGASVQSQARAPGGHSRWIRASTGNELIAAPLEEVLFFHADKKLTRVVLLHAEAWVHLGINSVAERLAGLDFWRIHRSTIVNLKHLHTMRRDELGRVEVRLRDRPERLRVSKPYERALFSDGLY